MGLIPRRVDTEQLKEFQPRLWLTLVGLLLLVAYVIAFIVKNSDRITIDFVFADAHLSLIWLILLCVGLGILGGLLLSQLARRRSRTRSGGPPQQPAGQRPDDLGEPSDAVVDVSRGHGTEGKPR